MYDAVVPSDHFFRRLRDSVRWDRYTYRLLKFYRSRHDEALFPMDPAMALRLLLLCEECRLTERQVEVLCNENMPAKYYAGLPIYEAAPSHTDLLAIKRRIVQNGKGRALGRLLRRIAEDALDKGATFERTRFFGLPCAQVGQSDGLASPSEGEHGKAVLSDDR